MADNAPLILGQLNTTFAATRLRTSLASGGPPTTQLSVESHIPAVTGTSVGSVGVLGVGIVGRIQSETLTPRASVAREPGLAAVGSWGRARTGLA